METRTPDLLITNQLLYQLSYAGLATRRFQYAEGRTVSSRSWRITQTIAS